MHSFAVNCQTMYRNVYGGIYEKAFDRFGFGSGSGHDSGRDPTSAKAAQQRQKESERNDEVTFYFKADKQLYIKTASAVFLFVYFV